MKRSIRISGLIFLVLIIFLFHSCKKEKVPILTTSPITNITGTSATSGGTITDEGSGTVIERGVCWSTGITPTIADKKTIDGGGAGTFVSNLDNLDAATTYYVRAYAKNEAGTGYGMAMSFTTLGQLPLAITQSACCLSSTEAKLNGIVNANLLSTTVTFEYGTTTAYGISVPVAQSPVTGNTFASVSANISQLTVGTTYHFSVKAVNSLGTTYGNDMLFTISSDNTSIIFNPDLTYGTISDIEGNVYKTIQIGTQTWMAENLKTTEYRNGDLIGTIATNIYDEVTPKYQWAYDRNECNAVTYGRLYTWFAVMDDRQVCPDGWHVPTDTEWTTLTDYLGGFPEVSGKLREIGMTHWTCPNTSATNETGFTALPGGVHYISATFEDIGTGGFWLSSSEFSSNDAYDRDMGCGSAVLRPNYGKREGLSVRCIKDK